MKCLATLLFLILLSGFSLASAEEILILPNDLSAIADEAFMGDSSLGAVILPNGVTSIGERAFAESSITSISLPENLEYIGADAFADCPNLTAIVIENSLGHLYCQENSIAYELLSEETQVFSSLYPRIWSEISAVVAPFEDSSGSVTAEERPVVLEAVEEYIKELHSQGIVTEYTIGDTCIGYRLNGISMEFHYGPHVKDTLSGGGDVSYSVYAVHPYSNNSAENLGSQENGIADKITSTFEIYHRSSSHEGTQVDLNAVNSFSTDEVILWCGHGHEIDDGSHWLGIGVKAGVGSEAFYQYCLQNGLIDTQVTEYAGRYAVNAEYIRNHCGDLSGSMVWLGACHSAEDTSFARAFLDCGAEAVVGYSDEVCYLYHDEIFVTTMNRMMERNEDTKKYYTLSEALSYATNIHGSSDPYLTQKGLFAQPILNGNGSYRLLELATVSGTVYEKNSNTGESTPLEEATVNFTCNDCGDVIAICSTASDGTFDVDLYEGNYTVEVLKDEHTPDTTELHLKGEVTADLTFHLNLIEGSVAGAFTDSFTTDVVEGVSLSITDSNSEVVWTGSTDADGFYRAYLVPGSYKLTASKEGYTSATYSFTIKADTQTTLNKTLQRILSTVSGTIFSSFDNAPLAKLPLEIVDMDENVVWTGTTHYNTNNTSTWGQYSAQLPPGEYTLTFPEPACWNGVLSIVEGRYSFFIEANQNTLLDCTLQCIQRYEECTGFASYEEAVVYCESIGAHLATLTTEEENALVYDWLGGGQYIGLNRANEAKEWRWITNESLEFTSWLLYNGKYQYPLDYEGHDYAQIYGGNKLTPRKWWNTTNGSTTSTYLFEWDNP